MNETMKTSDILHSTGRRYVGRLHRFTWLFLLATAICNTSCNHDEIEDQSIFDTTPPERNAFDNWLLENYVNPYNIDFIYKWNDSEIDMTYNLTPASVEQSVKLAKVVKYVWLEAYDEVTGINFMRTYVPKQILVIGSAAYNAESQTTVLGTAEGGLKVILYNVSNIDNYIDNPELLNAYYFHTMHHEFSHILHQTKPYSADFKTITESGYIGSQWNETTDADANKKGFVTAYAMDQPDEDFAEVISTYITNTPEYWNNMLEESGEEGAKLITRKFNMVRDYLTEYWNLDIDELRSVVLRRSEEVSTLDLETI